MEPVILAVIVGILVAVVFLALLRVRRQPPKLDEQTAEQLADRAPTLDVPDSDEPIPAGAPEVTEAAPSVTAPPRPTLSPSERFQARLGRARTGLGGAIASIFGGRLDDDAWEELEDSLIGADVGVDATLELVAGLRDRVRAENIRRGPEALALLKEVLRLELGVADRSLAWREDGTTVWLVTGVNGTGKTTSIGKVAARETAAGRNVVLAAADTFRAAAADQLELWGERAGARVVRQQSGADPAAVAFDGWSAASSADADLLIVDTAGRLQNKRALMDELGKVKRVLDREAGHVDEVLLVLDATTGQNGLVQASAFAEAVDVTGVVLTKLDSTAKGGIVIAIQRQLGLPVKLVGLGEDIEDLAVFDPDAFVDALFAAGPQDVEIEQAGAGEER
ncbi:MAG TPA: signal recognition particle-docking protein FtsY [Euzebyales bacterium]